MREFDYQSPRSLSEALGILARSNGNARALAGGTDLIDQMKSGRRTPSVVVDVKSIPELNRMDYVEGEGLHLGAAVSCARISNNPTVRERYPMLVQAASLIGDIKVQNRASVGGNLCNATPSADSAPAALCLGARAVIAGPGGQRVVPIEDFFLGPGRTILAPHELLVELIFPPPPAHSVGAYQRLTPRAEMDIAIVGVGSFLVMAASGSRQCREARIALCAVAPTPIRALTAEGFLTGRTIDEAAIREASERAAADAKPIDDHRASAEYRRDMVKALTQKTLHQCLTALSGR